jgi:hypothetical protein
MRGPPPSRFPGRRKPPRKSVQVVPPPRSTGTAQAVPVLLSEPERVKGPSQPRVTMTNIVGPDTGSSAHA